jgi:hypothetical protein
MLGLGHDEHDRRWTACYRFDNIPFSFMTPTQRIDPGLFNLRLTLAACLQDAEPSEYLTQFQGELLTLDDQRDDVPAGYITLTRFDLDRAMDEGQDPWQVFDCLSQEALDLYETIYDGFDFKKQVPIQTLSPSLLVIDTAEVLPPYRGGRLGLFMALKAMQLLGPAGGAAALVAAPLNQSAWRPEMEMQNFEPDCPQVRAKLGLYWQQLGFRPFRKYGLYLRSLEDLPTMNQLLASQP